MSRWLGLELFKFVQINVVSTKALLEIFYEMWEARDCEA